MEGGITVLVLFGNATLSRDQDPRDTRVAVPGGRVQGRIAVVILDVGVAAGEEQLPAGLVVPVLAAEVEGGEAAAVGAGQAGSGGGEQSDGSGVAFPCRFVQGAVAMLKRQKLYSGGSSPLHFYSLGDKLYNHVISLSRISTTILVIELSIQLKIRRIKLLILVLMFSR